MIEEFGENMSFDFCMDTGTNQNVTTASVGDGFWLLTLSDEAREKRLSERLKRIEDDSNK